MSKPVTNLDRAKAHDEALLRNPTRRYAGAGATAEAETASWANMLDEAEARGLARGYTNAIAHIRQLVRDVCDKRASELDDRTALSSLAFTRDRVLWAIDAAAERAAVIADKLERDSR